MRSVASNNLKKKTEEAVKAVLLRQLKDENVECNELLDEMGEQVTVLDDSNSIISQYEEILKKKKKEDSRKLIFANQTILHLARIYFRESASSKYFVGINFRE